MKHRKPRLFYFCYDHSRPTGGQKHTYQHVDALRSLGYDAYIYHETEAFRLTWFDNDTAVINTTQLGTLYDADHDFFVLPEDLGLRALDFPGRKVIFNKNLYYGFRSLKFDSTLRSPYQDPQIVAALTVSDHNLEHLRFAYPALDVLRVYPSIRTDIFQLRALRAKKTQIAWMPKSPAHDASLYHIFQSRAKAGYNAGQDWTWVMLGNRTEAEVSTVFQESLIFPFLNVEEGLPRMPLEAMACGCLVAAYGVGPLKEFLPSGYSFQHSNLIEIVKWMEAIVDSYPGRLHEYEKYAEEGYRTALRYSAAQQRSSVSAAWEYILDKHGK